MDKERMHSDARYRMAYVEDGLAVPYDVRTPEQKLAWQRSLDPCYRRIGARPGGQKPKPRGGRLRRG
jgi:hypothetical protein